MFSVLVTSCLTNQGRRDGRWAISPVGGVIIVLMPYVHGRAQPVGKLLTPDAVQLMEGRPHRERLVSDTPDQTSARQYHRQGGEVSLGWKVQEILSLPLKHECITGHFRALKGYLLPVCVCVCCRITPGGETRRSTSFYDHGAVITLSESNPIRQTCLTRTPAPAWTLNWGFAAVC